MAEKRRWWHSSIVSQLCSLSFSHQLPDPSKSSLLPFTQEVVNVAALVPFKVQMSTSVHFSEQSNSLSHSKVLMAPTFPSALSGRPLSPIFLRTREDIREGWWDLVEAFWSIASVEKIQEWQKATSSLDLSERRFPPPNATYTNLGSGG